MSRRLLFGGNHRACRVWAVDVSGNVAFGFDAIDNTVTVRWTGDGVGAEARLGVQATITSASTNLLLRPGTGVVIPFQLTADANLNLIGALDFVADLQNIGTITPTNTYDLIVSAGLAPEIFLSPKLSVETRVGLDVGLSDLSGTPVTAIALQGQGVSLTGGLRFHWYLN